MADRYDLMNTAVKRTEDLLVLALESAREAEDHANHTGIVSPAPAECSVLRQSVELAVNVARMKRYGLRCVPEQLEPPLPSYGERKAAVNP